MVDPSNNLNLRITMFPCRSQPLCLSAVKSSLGHTEPAAGATGICRSLLRSDHMLDFGSSHNVHMEPFHAHKTHSVSLPSS